MIRIVAASSAHLSDHKICVLKLVVQQLSKTGILFLKMHSCFAFFFFCLLKRSAVLTKKKTITVDGSLSASDFQEMFLRCKDKSTLFKWKNRSDFLDCFSIQ